MKLLNKKIKGKVVLAPMAGFTSSGYRKFYKKYGVSFSYTEMVSDMGLIYQNKETLEYLKQDKIDKPCGLQLFGHESEKLVSALKIALKINPNFAFVDINMACPVNKVTTNGNGSTLLKNPSLIKEIIRNLKANTTLPISIKIRLGIDDNNINYLEVIKAAEEAGVDFIALHARTKKQLYSGKPKYELISGLRSKMKVPLIISGDIFTVEDAINAINITGADYVMVARGGLGNPLLIKEINYYFKHKKIKHYKRSFIRQKRYCLDLAKCLIKEKGETKAMMIYRAIAPKFFNGFENSKKLRTALANSLVSYKSLKKILSDYKKDKLI